MIYCIDNVWYRGEPDDMISTLRDGHRLAVAKIDPSDRHTAGPIRLLTGSNTPAGEGFVVIAQKPTRQSRVNPLEEIVPDASPPLRWLDAMPSSRAQTGEPRPTCINNQSSVLRK